MPKVVGMALLGEVGVGVEWKGWMVVEAIRVSGSGVIEGATGSWSCEDVVWSGFDIGRGAVSQPVGDSEAHVSSV